MIVVQSPKKPSAEAIAVAVRAASEPEKNTLEGALFGPAFGWGAFVPFMFMAASVEGKSVFPRAIVTFDKPAVGIAPRPDVTRPRRLARGWRRHIRRAKARGRNPTP